MGKVFLKIDYQTLTSDFLLGPIKIYICYLSSGCPKKNVLIEQNQQDRGAKFQHGPCWRGVGSLSARAKMTNFVKRVFIIFETNASFLRVIVNLQI